ncbi:cytidylate kinase-like family protein, partial [Chloroflexi bacterium]|nr:cytidylate kinase-like family protein [Chloroflexota bacterium]
MYTITLGGMSGGGARDIGPLVAEKLRADYVDRIFLSTVAKQLGATVEALNQREEKLPTRSERWIQVIQRLLERSAVTGSAGDPYFGPGITGILTDEYEDLPIPTITRGHEVEDEVYIEAVEATMKEMAEDGDVVFVGRGGHVILKNMQNVLRVGVIASLDDRIETLMGRESIDRNVAITTLERRDQARKYFFKKFFQLDDPDDPQLFHFTI